MQLSYNYLYNIYIYIYTLYCFIRYPQWIQAQGSRELRSEEGGFVAAAALQQHAPGAQRLLEAVVVEARHLLDHLKEVGLKQSLQEMRDRILGAIRLISEVRHLSEWR